MRTIAGRSSVGVSQILGVGRVPWMTTDRIQDLLDAGARATLPTRGSLSESRAEELIIEIDRDRSDREKPDPKR